MVVWLPMKGNIVCYGIQNSFVRHPVNVVDLLMMVQLCVHAAVSGQQVMLMAGPVDYALV